MQAQGATANGSALARRLLEVWHRVTAGGAGGQMLAVLEEHGVSLTQVKLLETLLAADEAPSVKELAERIGLSLPATSRAVDGLCRRGYVDRRADADDRRVKRLSATPAGADVVATLDGARLANLERFAATLPPARRDALAQALGEILDGETPR